MCLCNIFSGRYRLRVPHGSQEQARSALEKYSVVAALSQRPPLVEAPNTRRPTNMYSEFSTSGWKHILIVTKALDNGDLGPAHFPFFFR